MEAFIVFCGLIGAWLLVAGSIYQAALELKDVGLERENLHKVQTQLPAPEHSSAWLWLVPPVKLLLEHRSSNRYRRKFLSALPDKDVEAMVSFMNKATGWLFVAGGGLLLAAKETYELVEHFQLSLWWFWVFIVALALLSFANTAARIARSERMFTHYKG